MSIPWTYIHSIFFSFHAFVLIIFCINQYIYIYLIYNNIEMKAKRGWWRAFDKVFNCCSCICSLHPLFLFSYFLIFYLTLLNKTAAFILSNKSYFQITIKVCLTILFSCLCPLPNSDEHLLIYCWNTCKEEKVFLMRIFNKVSLPARQGCQYNTIVHSSQNYSCDIFSS